MANRRQLAVVGIALASLIVTVIMACKNQAAIEGGAYATALEECNRNAKTLCESIACENRERAKSNRELRETPEHCKDGGQ